MQPSILKFMLFEPEVFALHMHNRRRYESWCPMNENFIHRNEICRTFNVRTCSFLWLLVRDFNQLKQDAFRVKFSFAVLPRCRVL